MLEVIESIQQGDFMDTKLIEKIQKLISLEDSPNKNEAEAAMVKAQELMLKHNIELRTIQNHDSEYIHETSDTFKRKDPMMKFINGILTKYFFVEIVISKIYNASFFNYIGEKKNVEVAIHTSNFLKATFKRLWKEYKKENDASERSKSSFHYGLYQGLVDRLESQKVETEKKI